MRKLFPRLTVALFALFAVALAWHFTFAAADLVQGGNDKHPWYVLAVTTAATKTITLQDNDIMIVHLNVQDDSGTASSATDKIVVMRAKDESGAAVTISTDFSAGVKLPIMAGGSATFRARGIPTGSNDKREIQIKAVGHDARVLIINGVPAK